MFFEILSFVTVSILSLICLWYTWIYYLLKPFKGKVTGPTVYPFLGNALLFPDPTSAWKQFEVLRKLYGGIFTIIVGLEATVVISDYKYIESTLKSTRLIEKSYPYRHFHAWLGTGLLTSGGLKWKQRRRIITPSYHFSILEQFVPVFDSVSDILVKVLKQEAGNCVNVDIYPYITLCALDIICETAMGCSINAQENKDSQYVRAVKETCQIVLRKVFSPLHQFEKLSKFTETYKNEQEQLKILNSLTMDIIEKKQAELEKSEHFIQNSDNKKIAFLDLLLKTEIDGRKLTNEELREEVATFMFEGHDTTASAISFALYCLSTHPEVEQRAFEEQREIFGDNKDAPITLKELNQMKYLDLVIRETLRLYPSVPFFGRQVIEDILLDDITISKNFTITVLAYAIQRDAKYFPNPNAFIPERFSAENFMGSKPYAYIPFSAGPRNCIGQKFAMLEMKTTISKVIRNFELSKSIPEHQLQLISEIILKSSNGIRMQIKERQ